MKISQWEDEKLRKRVSLKRLSVDTIKKLLQLIEKHIESSQTKRKRGRPKIYPDSFILLISSSKC